MTLQDIVYIFLQERYGNVKRNDWISPATMMQSTDFSIMIFNEFWYVGNVQDRTWRKCYTNKFTDCAEPDFFRTVEQDCNDIILDLPNGPITEVDCSKL